MDPQTELDLLETGTDDCQTTRRPLNQAKRVPETRKTTSDMTSTAEDNSKWDDMASGYISSRLKQKQPARPTTLITTTTTTQQTTHDLTTGTIKTRDQNEDDAEDDDDDDTQLILSQLIDS